MAINVGYFVKESLTNFRRNWVMSLGAVITIYLSLLLVGVSVGSSMIADRIVKSVEQKVAIRVFLRDGAAPEDVSKLQAELQADPRVKTVKYTSKEEAREEFKRSYASSPEMIEQLKVNPFPASLDVDTHKPQDVPALAESIKGNPTFLKVCDQPNDPEASIKYGKEWVGRLFSFTRILRIVGVLFIVMLAIISLIFINNTIRLAIYARRKEIGIMRLVGASNWFIRMPFLLEGLLQSLVGALLALASLAAFQVFAMPRIEESVPFLPFSLPPGAALQIAAVLIIGGSVIGLVGSGFALRRYLKV